MISTKRFDVIVIGAGPAGAMAARYAAHRGMRVALIERKKNVGIPVRCGEAIGEKGLAVLGTIDPKWVLCEANKVKLVSPAGHSVELHNINKYIMLNRELFDAALVDDAVAHGVIYFNETTVNSIQLQKPEYVCYAMNNTLELRATCVVIADGVESRLARCLGWNTTVPLEEIETCAFCHVHHDSIASDTVEVYTGTTVAPGGFVWVFPRGKNSANVGLGVMGARSEPGLPRKLLSSFVRKRFPGASLEDEHCGGVPVSRWVRPLVKHGALLVGDAARQVNSINGGGIAYSLIAGKLAGEVIIEAFRTGVCDYSHLKQYENRWASSWGKRQDQQHALKNILVETSDELHDSIAESLALKDPEKLTYFGVFSKVFFKHPLLLWKAFQVFRG